jgi:hypothetical protein
MKNILGGLFIGLCLLGALCAHDAIEFFLLRKKEMKQIDEMKRIFNDKNVLNL